MAAVAEGKPTKKFFVEMITRDISLQDCILDLVDNCVDGARRASAEKTKLRGHRFQGFAASLDIDGQHLRITDNCGGIPRDIAEHYAFRFGRVDAFKPEDQGIGLYGVGMKRAIFKLGRIGRVKSRLGRTGFQVTVDVETWRDDETNWDFPLSDSSDTKPPGTTVEIKPLWDQVAEVVQDPNFAADLREAIARDYAFLIGQGFDVMVNGKSIAPYRFEFRKGSGFAPMRTREHVDGVSIEVLAGFAESPPNSSEARDDRKLRNDPFGWYLACNDRIVLAADKSIRTIWGRDGFNRWHPQYRGFLGIVRFSAKDPKKLPWTTTKRGIDETTEAYRVAVERMESATERCIAYTESRRNNTDYATVKERKSRAVPALRVPLRAVPLFPKIPKGREKNPSITYTVPRADLDEAKERLGDASMKNSDVGLRTFRFFIEETE